MAEWGFIQRRICGNREIEYFLYGSLGISQEIVCFSIVRQK
jgi:hypothetical protein